MRSFTFHDRFAHCEDNPCFAKPRHPLVVFFHGPYAITLVLVFFLFTERTLGQTLYFMVTVGLYCSSAAYHTWKPSRFLRFVDQTMISWYVLVIPMPYLYREPWALPILLVMMVLTAANKWYEWEPNYTVGSIVFFVLGASSFALVMLLGLPKIEVELISWVALANVVATACFIGKLLIYQQQKGNLIPNVWESPESGHCVLSGGVSLKTMIITLFPL